MGIRKYGFLIAYLIPALTVIGYVLGSWYNYLTPLVIFGAVPLLDLIIGRYTGNQSDETYKELRVDPFFKIATWSYVPMQLALVVWGAWAITRGNLALHETIGLVLSIGVVTGGIGITVAHELGHRTDKLEQFLAKTLLMSVSYMHFFIEHNQGHHAQVATPHDPASARFGESFYRFYPRTLWGGFHHAWVIETRRLSKRGYGLWSRHNQMLWFVFWPILFAVALGLAFGPAAFVFFFIQSIIAFTLLELVNYVEHYGLERDEVSEGKYEKVKPHHSWNASQSLTNSLLFNLQRHSDHHANATRRYQTLRHFDEAPQLPTGYAGMILLALAPPLWRSVMDNRALRATGRLAEG